MVYIILFYEDTESDEGIGEIVTECGEKMRQQWLRTSRFAARIPETLKIAVTVVLPNKKRADFILNWLLTAPFESFERIIVNEDVDNPSGNTKEAVTYEFSGEYSTKMDEFVRPWPRDDILQTMIDGVRMADVLDLKHVIASICNWLSKRNLADVDDCISRVYAHRLDAAKDLVFLDKKQTKEETK
jgi:hypothetical protein